MYRLGDTRLNAFAAEPDALPPSKTPEETLNGWTSKLKHMPSTNLEQWLVHWSGGITKGWGRVSRQDAFQELLLHSQFDVFCDVFEIEGPFEYELPGSKERAFKTSLELNMPPDWNPDRREMDAAFSRIRVDELIVSSPHRWGENTPPAGKAVCDAIVALLKGGTSELSIEGTLCDPDVVASAFETTRLRSIDLKGWPASSVVDERDMERQETLLGGLAKSFTFSRLLIGDPRLLKLGPCLEKWLVRGWPKLESVSVSLSHGYVDDTVAFMTTIAKFQSLSSVSVSHPRPDVHTAYCEIDMAQAVLAPLAKHPSLHRLEIQSGAMSYPAVTREHVARLFKVVEFAVACPALKHLAWKAVLPPYASATFHMRAFTEAGGDVDLLQMVADMAAMLKATPLHLQTLVLNGFPLVSRLVSVLYRSLAGNKSLRYLDLEGCLHEVGSLKVLVDAILQNPWIEKILIPMDRRAHWMLCPDGLVWEIVGHGDVFTLAHADADATAQALAISTFDRHKGLYTSLPTAIRRNALMKDARPPLEGNIAAFMQAAIQAVQSVEVDAGKYTEAARITFAHLALEQRLPTAVHLGRVSKKIRGIEDIARDTFSVRSLVRAEVATHGQLLEAVEAGDTQRIADLLASREVDVGGHAFKRAQVLVNQGRMASDLLDVFRRFDPVMAPPVSSTTTTTTTTTATTTTTTISSSPTVQQTRTLEETALDGSQGNSSAS
ncbi:hypothetical protein [Hydrogenophaga sp.]|uniref:hypothetical protein n=1 Tax=Hydrogenophaga sp. TaxID=1904254 RepID=UPI002727C7C5|nr:hypothetical protein [Hydrogenophaga sp.]MDO9437786.1 hypothetical protein [Hydrogenophaga sp.]